MNPAIENAAEKNKLADDLLRGADQIADFLFGEPGQRRKVSRGDVAVAGLSPRFQALRAPIGSDRVDRLAGETWLAIRRDQRLTINLIAAAPATCPAQLK
jgi:hypothetical protein